MSLLLSRRSFLKGSLAAGAALSTAPLAARRPVRREPKLRVLSIGVIGTIGGYDRRQVASHPRAEIVGLCDVDAQVLAKAAKEHPKAFRCRDYREAFAEHANEFDAIICAVPDHSHAPIMLTAMQHDKHVYGQKPLVHQLEELDMLQRAIEAKPELVTQLGNQRMSSAGRQAAVEVLRRGLLGRAVEAIVWTDSPSENRYFNYWRKLNPPKQPPSHLDWELWLGPCEEAPYRDGLAPIRWRSWWDYGSGGLGDWGCHLLDVLFYAYDELQSPFAVQTHCHEPSNKFFHVAGCRSQLTYAVESHRFAKDSFTITYQDHHQKPSRAALGLPEHAHIGKNGSIVVGESATMVLEAGGRMEIYRHRRGKQPRVFKMGDLPQLPVFPKINHWHAWVDNCLGIKTKLWTPFRDGLRMTEAALLAVKATRFPGAELRWNREKLEFSNHKQASESIVRRKYREGFAPPCVG
ncbi:MAG: hypothetical protein CSA62_08375 [Planctomycetota bacterium]|nr:MAG: hypothetical protein CSA62_08375 [Planctomycetota bacterium]